MVLAMEPVTEVWESLEEWHRKCHLFLREPYPVLRVFKKIAGKKTGKKNPNKAKNHHFKRDGWLVWSAL